MNKIFVFEKMYELKNNMPQGQTFECKAATFPESYTLDFLYETGQWLFQIWGMGTGHLNLAVRFLS